MHQDKLEQIIQEGIYGKPEIRPEEKHLFLGTYAERVRLALTNGQVYKKGMYEEALQLMSRHNDMRMLINGNLPYTSYNNYVKAANEKNVPFTVHNDFQATPLGIVFTTDYAIHQEDNIFIKDSIFEEEMGKN
ncbi:YueI family protein [Alkalicoccus daliensis]|uniref:Uncharacterized protein YueI n=1 Tax=Alkalicoccus daliensis TaxID=745820 RepID=A0A1H0B7W3_9BACI|nr:YueI family protein [Alkalicoccus daliensis]SDN41744.1 Uncharacterized protein YueI [Alkalicoccus daliensis]